MATMMIHWQQWRSIGRNGVIGDSGANGSPIVQLVPMMAMAETVPMVTMVLNLTLILTLITVAIVDIFSRQWIANGSPSVVVAIGSPMTLFVPLSLLSPMVPPPFDDNPGHFIAI